RCRYSVWPPASRWPAMGRPMTPRPIKPIFMKLSSLIGLHPAEARTGIVLGLVFAADEAVIAKPVELVEHEIVIDLARARFVAPRVVGDLDVSDAVAEPLEGRHQVTLHDLHVIEVVLDDEVVGTGGIEDALGVVAERHEEAGDIAGI